jgi:hypothetical protein
MVTILREAGFRFLIFTDDHEPAHVHVIGDGSAKIDISGPAPRLVQADGMKAGDLRKAMRIVADRYDDFLARWRSMHG